MPRISILTTIYNKACYLDKCIQSVLVQDFSDYELILFDDGSTDDSFLIAQKYQAEHPAFIRLYRQDNQGWVSAINRCINVATGEYLLVLNSDDSLSPRALSTLYSFAEKNGCDVVYFDYASVDCNGTYVRNISPVRRVEASPGFFEGGIPISPAMAASDAGVLFKKELMSGITYKAPSYGADAEVMWEVFAKANKIGMCTGNYYIQLSRPDSESHTASYHDTVYEMVARQMRFFDRHSHGLFPTNRPFTYVNILDQYIMYCFYRKADCSWDGKNIRRISKELRRSLPLTRIHRKLGFRQVIKEMLWFFFPGIMVRVHKGTLFATKKLVG